MKYIKMNGLGNEFVVLDARRNPFVLTPDQARKIASPETGVKCDQILILENSDKCDVFMRIWNSNGEKVAACGNGTRAVAWLLTQEKGMKEVSIETEAGELFATLIGPMKVAVDMGKPGLDWTQIPMSERMDTIRMELQVGPIDKPILWGPGAVSMGNPHCVFFVDDAETAPVVQVGSMIEHHPLFPERANVGFAQVLSRDHIRLRVWERGAGLTRACGTGACAAMVAASRRKLIGRNAVVTLDGGDLEITWRIEDDHVIMSGAVEYEGGGEISF
ncbi:MAG: diaminopimelate epimerase [Hyphomonadaceae bacterium]|nr:MAG: diaminopimelate epimerase [Hyphomonadaceae bacterium]